MSIRVLYRVGSHRVRRALQDFCKTRHGRWSSTISSAARKIPTDKKKIGWERKVRRTRDDSLRQRNRVARDRSILRPRKWISATRASSDVIRGSRAQWAVEKTDNKIVFRNRWADPRTGLAADRSALRKSKLSEESTESFVTLCVRRGSHLVFSLEETKNYVSRIYRESYQLRNERRIKATFYQFSFNTEMSWKVRESAEPPINLHATQRLF
jgi:hypothetical protein